MKLPVMSAVAVVVGLLAALAVGCGSDADVDDPAVDEGEIGVGEQSITAVPMCQDIVLHQVQQKLCDPQKGPLDTSPVVVNCTRTCTTDRHLKLPPPVSGDQCESGATTCTPWVCPSCD